jgi:cystathionine beta-lyase/cystathionine gamma-synthase
MTCSDGAYRYFAALCRFASSLDHPPVPSDEQRAAAGAGDDVVRLPIGLEMAEDLIRDLDQALGG